MPNTHANLGPVGALGTGLTRKRTVRMAEAIGAPSWKPSTVNRDLVEFTQSFRDIYPRSDLRARVIWSTKQTSSGAVTFRLTYKAADPNAGETNDGTLSAMDTVIAKDTIVGTNAYDVHKTEFGIINPGSVSPADDVRFRLDISSASSLTVGANADDVTVHGVEFEYMAGTLI